MIDCLVGKAELALKKTGYSILCVGGGVAANGRFRARLEESAAEHGYELYVPPLSLCTDNAVMGAIAVERLRAGKFEDLSLDISPGPERGSQSGRQHPRQIKNAARSYASGRVCFASPKLSKTTAPSAVLLPALATTYSAAAVPASNSATISPRPRSS